jgi:hypothetical protein
MSKKPLLLFKSFTGLTVQEFDSIYNKEIAKKYEKHDTTVIMQTKRKYKEYESLVLGDLSN